MTYTLIFYTRKAFFDSAEPQNISENFTDFTQCVLRAKELMYSEQVRLEGLCFPNFNCLIKWENNSLRCDYSLQGFNFRSCGGNETQEHLWKLNDIWEGRY